ncbi:MAG TPA: HEAT repeat domain-containing protein [Bacteroidota bacterium]|nr:HEAT repeat domain-containing protein [Bacteroidota bacterium]
MSDLSMRELLQLYLYDELSTEERRRVEATLSTSAEWKSELEALRKFHGLLAHAKPAEADERRLVEARNELRTAIRIERTRPSWKSKFAEFIEDSVFAQYKLALGGVVTVAAGFLLGYAVFASRVPETGSLANLATTVSAAEQPPQLANVRFIGQNNDNGTVELTFDAITPVHIKGNVNDPQIAKVLAQALVSERNPGVRLRTVSAISDQSTIQPSVEKEVKTSLITVLKYDHNPGVRKEALKALQKFPIDDDVVEAVLYVLKNEKNTGMRIAAINCLDFSKLTGKSVDKDLLDLLKERMQSDDNNYIRIRGNAAFQEISK